jgi:hypothetical protein
VQRKSGGTSPDLRAFGSYQHHPDRSAPSIASETFAGVRGFNTSRCPDHGKLISLADQNRVGARFFAPKSVHRLTLAFSDGTVGEIRNLGHHSG